MTTHQLWSYMIHLEEFLEPCIWESPPWSSLFGSHTPMACRIQNRQFLSCPNWAWHLRALCLNGVFDSSSREQRQILAQQNKSRPVVLEWILSCIWCSLMFLRHKTHRLSTHCSLLFAGRQIWWYLDGWFS